MELVQEITQDQKKFRIYTKNNVDLEKYDLDQYKLTGIFFSFLDRFENMRKKSGKGSFEVVEKGHKLLFSYKGKDLTLVEINNNTL